MNETLDDTRLAAWRAFLNAHVAVIGCIERELAEANLLPLTWYDVLVALAQAPERRLRMGELARAVVLSPSGITRLIDRLEGERLLVRERSSTDRRAAYAVLTPQGLKAVRQTWPVYARGIEMHFARFLSDREVQTLTAMLDRIFHAARASC